MKKLLLKKNFLFVSLFFFSLASVAQITVTRNDFVNAGDVTIAAHDTVHASVTPGGAGASQTWNLSSLLNHYSDTTNFSNPASTPYAASFPSANLTGYNTLDSSYYYVNASNASIDVLGYVAPNPFTGNALIFSFSPAMTQLTFPSTLATAFTVTNATGQSSFYYSGTYLSFTYDSLRVTSTNNRTSIVDGWGTVTTPAGTFNAIRQKMTEYSTQVIEAYVVTPALGWTNVPFGSSDTTLYYFYFANGQNWALAEIATDPVGTVTEAQYLMNVVIGIPEYSAAGNNDVMLYPNPSVGEINISVLNSNVASLDVFDMFGRKTETLFLSSYSDRYSFSSYAVGLYSFRVIDKRGAVISTGKFMMAK